MEQQATVLYEYKADGDNQLTIKKGETITLVGDPTPESWILARNKNGDEGYIPDEYFKRKGKASKPKVPPPLPEGIGSSTTTKSTSSPVRKDYNSKKVAINDGGIDGEILNKNDVYNIYAYQFEWGCISLGWLTALFTFMYGTTLPIEGVYYVVFGLLMLGIMSWMMYMIGFKREDDCFCCEVPDNRMYWFLTSGIIFAGCYPIGLVGAFPCFLGVYIEYQVKKKRCKPVPRAISDNWKAKMFGGCSNCETRQLIVFFGLLIADVVAIAWGYIHGRQRARNFRDDQHDIRPGTFGLASGFGRLMTCNLAIMLLWMCHGCFSSQVKRLESNNKQGTRLHDCCSTMSDPDRRLFFHRLLGYNFIVAAFLHSMCHYFVYEQSGSTHTFIARFGYESIGTGFALLFFLIIVIGSANKALFSEDKPLFNKTHLFAGAILAFIIFWHGSDGLNNNIVFILVTVPFVLFMLDVLFRWLNKQL